MKAFSSPKLSARTLLTGARQLVVQLALLRMLCFSGSYVSLFTPMTMVVSGPSAGADMRTFLAPAVRCLVAPSRLVNKPVDSTAKYTPRSFHGSAAGSFWLMTLRVLPLTTRSLPETVTVPLKRPWTLSYLSRCALVFASVRSLTATKSMLAFFSIAAR